MHLTPQRQLSSCLNLDQFPSGSLSIEIPKSSFTQILPWMTLSFLFPTNYPPQLLCSHKDQFNPLSAPLLLHTYHIALGSTKDRKLGPHCSIQNRENYNSYLAKNYDRNYSKQTKQFTKESQKPNYILNPHLQCCYHSCFVH